VFRYFRAAILICILSVAFIVSIFPFTAFASTSASEDKPLIILVSLTDTVEGNDWYASVDEYARLSAEALNADFEHLTLGDLREGVIPLLEARFLASPKPDYIVFANQMGLGLDILKLAEKHQVKSFLYNEPLSPNDYKNTKGPRGQFKNWLGQLIPNDEQVGYDLANYLIDDAKRRKLERGDTSKVKMVAMSGRRTSPAASLRYKGLMRAIESRTDVHFLQSVSGRWSTDVAARKYSGLKQRYGQIDAVWNANDSMALGVVKAVEMNEFPPSIGGVDWIEGAVNALSDQTMVATMGGHVFDIAYVIALIRKYHDGIDFAKDNGTYSLKSSLMSLRQDNLNEFQSFLKYKNTGKVNFKSGFENLIRSENLNNITIERFVEQSMAQDL